MKVAISPGAEGDLTGIGDWIALESPLRAVTFIRELRERCSRLGNMPNAYPLVRRHEAAGIRRYAFRDYLIFYRVTSEQIEVLHIVHGARDLDALLFPED